MTRPTTVRTVLAAAALVAGAVVPVVAAAPARAEVLPSDDVFLVYSGSTYTLDPLANDDALPGSGTPRLCGLSGGDARRAYVERTGDRVELEAVEGWGGTLTYTYEVCDDAGARARATMRVEVDALLDLTARRKRGAPGAMVVSNPNPVAVTVAWGSATSGKRDGTRTVPGGRSTTVKVRHARAYWVGFLRDRGVLVTAGDGVVRLRGQ